MIWLPGLATPATGSPDTRPADLTNAVTTVISLALVWIVPMRSRTAIVTIVLAASMSPRTGWLAESFGWVQFSDGSIAFVIIAMVFSVLMGVAVSNVVYKLGKSAEEARGMGEVWVAGHRTLARLAAVKFIRRKVIAGMDAASIQRPNQRFGPIEPERAVCMLIQVCHSIHEAHRRRLIHRDIEPVSLFVCEQGDDRDFVKALDFGLVKHEEADDEADPKLTHAGSIAGTPAYVYPEAITGTSPVDHRSDIYSMGCVAYWLLTGQLVFGAETPLAMPTKYAPAQPTPPPKHSELEMPEALDDVVLACLAKHPDGRSSGSPPCKLGPSETNCG